jgi:tetratricopeptide (TPR) repeat protein
VAAVARDVLRDALAGPPPDALVAALARTNLERARNELRLGDAVAADVLLRKTLDHLSHVDDGEGGRGRALRPAEADTLRAVALSLRGQGLERLGDRSDRVFAEAVGLFAELDDAVLSSRDRCDYGVALAGVGRDAEARAHLERARADESMTPEATRHLARLVLADGDAVRAENLVHEALQISPTDPDSYVVLAEARARQGQPDAGTTFVDAAYLFLQQNRPQAAHEALNAAERHLGEEREHLGLRGEAFRLQGRHAEAIDTFERLLATDPENPWVRARRAASLAALGRHDEAQSDAARAVAAAGRDDVLVLLFAASAALASGDGPRALAYSEDALRADPRHPGSYLLRAKAELAAGSTESALQFIQAGQTLAPHDLDLIRLKADVERRLGEDTAALGTLRALCDSAGSMPEDHGALAQVLNKLGNRGDAMAVVSTALERWPESADLLVLQGTLLLEDRQPEDSVRVLTDAASLYPDHPDVLLGLARGEYEQGRLTQASEAAAAAASARPEWAEAWAMTARIEASQDPATSYESARRTLDLDPNQPDALLILARQHVLDGDAAAAERIVRQARSTGATDPEFTLIRAQALQLRERDAKALRLLIDVPEQVEDDPRLLASWLRTRGQLHRTLRHWTEAEKDLRRVLALQADDPEVLFLLADVARLSGDVEEAARLGRRTLALDPGHVLAHGTLGAALLALDETEEGRQTLRDALDLDPTYAFGLDTLVQNIASREPDEARALVRRAQAASPGDRELQLVEARLEARLGNFRESLVLWDAIVDARPDVEALVGRSEALRKLGRIREAVQDAEQAVALEDDKAEASRALAFALIDDDDLDHAIEVLTEARDRNPNDTGTLAVLGYAYARADRADDALGVLDLACTRSPQDPEPLSQLAWLLTDLADYHGAATLFNRATTADAQDAFLWSGLGWSLMNDDHARLPEAEAAYRRAVQLDPYDPWLVSGVANVLHSRRDPQSWSHYEQARSMAEELQSENREMVSLIAWCRFRLGDPAGAAVLFQEAQAREPRPGSELFDLALTLLCAGRDRRAEQTYRNAANRLAGRVPGLAGRDPLMRRGLLTIAMIDLRQAFLDYAELEQRPTSERIVALLGEELASLPEVPRVQALSQPT